MVVSMSYKFDAKIYKMRSQDLRVTNYSENELLRHFNEIGMSERRSYCHTDTASEYYSSCYLRGQGIEIGAGKNPIKLMGNARCEYGDIAEHALFDSDNLKIKKIIVNLNSKINSDLKIVNKYDFVVAQHVLEHCDSMVRSLSVLRNLCKSGGVIYISLPNKNFDKDSKWIRQYGLMHHIAEYFVPRFFSDDHKKNYIKEVTNAVLSSGGEDYQGSEVVSTAMQEEILKGNIPHEHEYLYHKHSYSLEGWLHLLLKLNALFKIGIELIDCGFGLDRNDCHFVFLAK